MAPDGTGGIVYRKRVDGRTHIFAAQFDGRALARRRSASTIGQRFDSSWPAIGAGNGGRLVVAWVQEFGPASDRLYSAALDAGRAPLPGAGAGRPQRRRGDRHVAVAGDERERQRRTSPTS